MELESGDRAGGSRNCGLMDLLVPEVDARITLTPQDAKLPAMASIAWQRLQRPAARSPRQAATAPSAEWT
jgi:hypothetical protein